MRDIPAQLKFALPGNDDDFDTADAVNLDQTHSIMGHSKGLTLQSNPIEEDSCVYENSPYPPLAG